MRGTTRVFYSCRAGGWSAAQVLSPCGLVQLLAAGLLGTGAIAVVAPSCCPPIPRPLSLPNLSHFRRYITRPAGAPRSRTATASSPPAPPPPASTFPSWTERPRPQRRPAALQRRRRATARTTCCCAASCWAAPRRRCRRTRRPPEARAWAAGWAGWRAGWPPRPPRGAGEVEVRGGAGPAVGWDLIWGERCRSLLWQLCRQGCRM